LAISREKKEELVASYVESFAQSHAAIMTDYRGLSVADLQELRKRLRQVEGKYIIVKNTLAKRALQQLDLPIPQEMLSGPTAIGFCQGEVPAVAKALQDFAKESKVLQIKGGLMEGRALTTDEVSTLASMPPREVILAQMLGSVQAPANRVAGAVAGVMRNILYLLQAHVERLEEQGSTA
jgi:large subunit ribosomal protein L10